MAKKIQSIQIVDIPYDVNYTCLLQQKFHYKFHLVFCLYIFIFLIIFVKITVIIRIVTVKIVVITDWANGQKKEQNADQSDIFWGWENVRCNFFQESFGTFRSIRCSFKQLLKYKANSWFDFKAPTQECRC